ncbi:hypothetical protein BD410DRAFT_462014 [Rickenella mellea]|uniref:Uncharacterized protein n=1 Tax=Rickenella mellea TaxID=50990 RepID=A0A4Y7PDP9_9AGAM|nr:hypothetical protein BD410DRAFT_462014 [Rickenella mellea]
MSIEPGAYLIQNVKHRNFAAQSTENKVEGYADTGMYPSSVPQNVRLNLRKLWSISRLDNDKYTIRNIETNDYAAVRNFSVIEENIITTEFMQPWDVKETGFKGRYVIYSTAASIDLYWGLTDGQLGTLVGLILYEVN